MVKTDEKEQVPAFQFLKESRRRWKRGRSNCGEWTFEGEQKTCALRMRDGAGTPLSRAGILKYAQRGRE